MTLLVLAWASLGCAAVPALLYLWNSFLFREPPVLPPFTKGEVQIGGRFLDLPSPSFGESEAITSSWVRGEPSAREELRRSPEASAPSPGGEAPPPSPARGEGQEHISSISVLIPARNEEHGIEACVRSVLASRHVELEVVVLDDASSDRTADIVRSLAASDSRVRLETAPPLPAGWCGKQHACFTLSKLARFDTLTFLDADVRLEPDALARMELFLKQSDAELVSGFPRQETGTFLEKLLIPLINWLLLCFLPLWGMRHSRWSAYGAGCGQWFMTTRTAYDKVGGHAAVKASLHDGLTLPRAYRKAGLFTDICDATQLATCRMYRSGSAVWFGLAKNAREGMAATGQIGFWTVVLICGQVLPFVLLLVFAVDRSSIPRESILPVVLACAVVAMVRERLAARFGRTTTGEVLHPVAILLLLTVQWYAVLRAAIGKPVGWKGRAHPTDSPSPEPK